MFDSIELFAGAGGLSLGLNMAGFSNVLLNDNDSYACASLRNNMKKWNVVEKKIEDLDVCSYRDIDLLSGGFPCQPFSYAGSRKGFGDVRGTLFIEFARVVDEVQPKLFLIENVKGLTSHDEGRTFLTIKNYLVNLGYTILDEKVLNSINYRVPQKRERIFIVGIRNDLLRDVNRDFKLPIGHTRQLTLRDALKGGILYDSDVPESPGQSYSQRKADIMRMVPEGGCWVDLPCEVQKEYMKASYLSGGGRRGCARRLSWDKPSPTITCSPSQKQTERCHPSETRPLTIRECARIQTFPDEWDFSGSLSNQYKQIGNAVPVNMALEIGEKLIILLNDIKG